MKFLNNFAACFFKEEADTGHTVFFPWGALGRGRRIADPAKAEGIRRFLNTYYMWMFWGVVVLTVLQFFLAALLLFAVSTVVYWLVIAHYTKGCPSTAVRLQVSEAQHLMARQYSARSLKWFYWGSIILCVGSFGVFLAEQETTKRLIALVGIGLFGTGIWLFGRLRRFKRQHMDAGQDSGS